MAVTIEQAINGLDVEIFQGCGVIVFSVMRNERVRLTAWLQHYRDIGVRRFLIVDNGSTDGSYEYLLGETDVVVLRVLDSFGAAGCGIEWLNAFRSRLTEKEWVLFVDGDEFLVYRGWPSLGVSEFVNRLEMASANAALGFMLDMYPTGDIAEAIGAPASFSELISLAPYFDGEYVFRLRKRKPWDKSPHLPDVLGGPRIRLLSSIAKEQRSSWVRSIVAGQIDRFIQFLPNKVLPFVARYWPAQAPRLTKVPLANCSRTVQYVSNHTATVSSPYCENVVLLHFKFLADFVTRVSIETSRQEHYRRGLEYFMYSMLLESESRFSFKYEGSIRFDSAESLIGLGLIRNVFESYVQPSANKTNPALRRATA